MSASRVDGDGEAGTDHWPRQWEAFPVQTASYGSGIIQNNKNNIYLSLIYSFYGKDLYCLTDNALYIMQYAGPSRK